MGGGAARLGVGVAVVHAHAAVQLQLACQPLPRLLPRQWTALLVAERLRMNHRHTLHIRSSCKWPCQHCLQSFNSASSSLLCTPSSNRSSSDYVRGYRHTLRRLHCTWCTLRQDVGLRKIPPEGGC